MYGWIIFRRKINLITWKILALHNISFEKVGDKAESTDLNITDVWMDATSPGISSSYTKKLVLKQHYNFKFLSYKAWN